MFELIIASIIYKKETLSLLLLPHLSEHMPSKAADTSVILTAAA